MGSQQSYIWCHPFYKGSLVLAASPLGVYAIQYEKVRTRPPQELPRPLWADRIDKALELYLREACDLRQVPIDWQRVAGTPFQQEVWRKLHSVPVGSTVSYGQLAAQVGRPGASRAVGSACARNPVLLVVPCHRVLSKSGLGGFSGGGLWVKRWLLQHEATNKRLSLLCHGMAASH